MTEAASATLEQLSGDPGLIDVTIRVAPDAAPGRVSFDVVITNTSPAAVVVSSPYEGLSYQLIDSSGTPVQVDAPPSQAKVHVKRDPAAKRAYLDIVSARVGDDDISPDEVLGAATFELAGGDDLTMHLVVTSAIDVSDRSRLDRVPPGDYQLVVMLRTVVDVDDDRHPMQFRTPADGLAVHVAA